MYGSVRKKITRESSESSPRDEEGLLAQWQEREEGEKPQASDRYWVIAGTQSGRQGAFKRNGEIHIVTSTIFFV